MNTSHNHLHEPCSQESSFLKARAYLSDLSKPEKEVLMTNLGVGAGRICVENFPDEEDLTTEMRGSRNVLKFKDKIFNPAKCSGMGKVFLRKNIVRDIETGKPMNILTQSMFEDEHGLPLINTIFVIQYHYNLDKGFITIPENSILLFAGGSFCNGTVILKNTLILPAAIDIERFMPVNIKGTYKEGSLLYIRKHLRLFDGRDWINLGGREDFGPCDKHGLLEFVKKYVNGTMDIVSPFKIVITPHQNYIEKGPHDILVKWSYNRIIDNQDIRLESGNKYKKYYELDKHARHFIFKDIDAESPVTIVVSTTYRGETVSEAITLTFDRNPGLVIDDELDEESTNPVENQAITKVIKNIQLEIQGILADLGLYLTKEEAENIYATINLVNNKERDIKDWVEDKNYLTEHQSLAEYVKKSELKPVATSGSYNDLTDKPTNVSQFNNDAHYITAADIPEVDLSDYVKNSELARVAKTGEYSDLNGKPNLAAVAFSGNYNDLTNKPNIPSSADFTDFATKDELNRKQDALPRGSNGQVLKWNNGSWQPGEDIAGQGGGISREQLDTIIKTNLDIKHSGKNLFLSYDNVLIGSGTPDNEGEGGDGGGGGTDGLPGTVLTYYIQVYGTNKPSTPADSQISDLSSASGTWSPNMPNHRTGYSIWMSQIYETHSGTAWGNWSDPILLDDGSEGSSSGSDKTDREYIYARANVENFSVSGLCDPSAEEAVQQDDYIPCTGWYDNPQAVSQEMRFEFISVRIKDENGWSRFTPPTLWSSYGLNGADGDGVEYIFYKGFAAPLYNADNPQNWYTDEDSKAGRSDRYGKKYNSDEYILQGTEWYDNPQDMDPGENTWVSIRKYRNDSDSESAEAEGSYWHQYSAPTLWAKNQVDVENAGVLDFDNQTMGIPLNENGNNYAFNESSNAYIYKGAGTITITGLTCKGLWDGDSVIWSESEASNYVSISNNKVVTVSIPVNTLRDIKGKTLALKFTATADSVDERTGTIKLIGLSTGTDGTSYKLVTGLACIKKGVGTQTGSYYPDTIYPTAVLTKGNQEPVVYKPSELPSSLSIDYIVDDNVNPTRLNENSIYIENIVQEKITIRLLYNGNVIDQETIFAINDGVQGISATVYNILPQSSNVINTEGRVTGQLTFKVSRKYGDQPISYLQNGEFVKTEESGATERAKVKVELDGTLDITEDGGESAGGLQVIDVDSAGNYNVIVITLLVGQSETEMASIVVPITQAGSEGSQTLNPGILRDRSNTISSESPVTFYDGRNPDLSAGGIYYQDFIKWNGHKSNGTPDYDNWGTYLCVTKCNVVPNDIPGNSNFVKLDYSFGEVVSYLIADRAFIDNLASKQVIITDDNNRVVAGMTSGSRIPTVNPDGTINPDGPGITNNNNIRIWAGESNNNIVNAPFTVDSTGHLKASDAEIKGTVDATSFKSTSFKVYDRSTSDENNLRMEMTTWSSVSALISSDQKAIIDQSTLNALNSNPSTPVIVVSDGTNKYILNMLAFNGDSGPDPTRVFWDLTKNNGKITETPYQFTVHNGLYYNNQNIVRDFTGYIEILSTSYAPFTYEKDNQGIVDYRLVLCDAEMRYYEKIKIIDGVLQEDEGWVYAIGNKFSNGSFSDNSQRIDYYVEHDTRAASEFADFGNNTYGRFNSDLSINSDYLLTEYEPGKSYIVEDSKWQAFKNQYNSIRYAKANSSNNISPANGLLLIKPYDSGTFTPSELIYFSN